MSQATLEERVARLENFMDSIVRGKPGEPPKRKDWRRTIGMFDGDPVMKEIIDEALRMRDEERRLVNEHEQRVIE
jgi:hypothetical protein